jgi:hypothetical protein
MSKLYETLQPAERIRLPMTGVAQGRPRLSTSTRRQLETLYQSLESSLSSAGRAVAFTASRTGEGTTTIVQQFAAFLISTFKPALLIVDANPNQAVAKGWDGGLTSLAELVRALPSNGGPRAKRQSISIASLPPDVINILATGNDAAELVDMARLRARFDYILFDVPAISTHPAAVSIGRHVDGVVIIVEAERTRWPVVVNTKRAYQSVGAEVLGVVLNKRRFYIPSWIYKKL